MSLSRLLLEANMDRRGYLQIHNARLGHYNLLGCCLRKHIYSSFVDLTDPV